MLPPPEEGRDEPSGEEPLEDFYGDVVSFRPAEPRLPPVPPKKARTAAGALLTGIALGLRNVFDPEKKNDTIAIEQEAPAEPDGPQRYEIRLNGSPRDAQAVYRPWVDPEAEGP
ncbi:MAG: hypothetical protein M3066_11880 [Actinomycetota bacterium]|nr:hypothetical protein [Actinomycetota bacterium]